MFKRGMFDDMKEKAQTAYNQAKEQGSNLSEQIKSKIEDNISRQNNISNIGSEFINNKAINNSAQLLFEKSIEQAESIIYKYVPPYSIEGILDEIYIGAVIKEILGRQVKEPSDKNSYDLAVLYINNHDLTQAELWLSKITDATLKNKLNVIISLLNMNDQNFVVNFDLQKQDIIDTNIYTVLRRYANIQLTWEKYGEAWSVIERCCELNPISLEDQKDLLMCLTMLNEKKEADIQGVIIKILG